MKLLTKKQKEFLWVRDIEVGHSYSFPSFGFMIYQSPHTSSGMYLDTNPFFKSLESQSFLVKEKVGDYCKGNFLRKPNCPDFYMKEIDLKMRGLTESFILFIICSVPMIIYNAFKGGASKIDTAAQS